MTETKLTKSSRIKYLRKKRGFTLESLAKASGVSKAHIHCLERGGLRRPGAKTLMKLAKALETDIEYLMGRLTESQADDLVFFRQYQAMPHHHKKLFRVLALVALKWDSEKK